MFVSSDLKEVLDIADTVCVIANGETKAKLPNHQLSSEQVLSLCYE